MAIALPRTPAGRIALAIGLSLLAHALALFAPLVKLAPSEPPLPPLTAKLEPLPQIVAKPKPIRKPKPAPAPQPAVPELLLLPPEQPAAEAAPPPPPAEETPAAAAQPAVEAQSAPAATDTGSQPAHPLPRHAQLTFVVYMGTNVEIGEMRHRFDVDENGHYLLTASVNTTGLARLLKSYEMNQQSSGTMTALGLRPDEFSTTLSTSRGKESISVKFDWQAKALSFPDGRAVALPDQTQDFVSFLYQLSQLPLTESVIPIYISNGRKLERYQLTVGPEEEIQSRLGTLRALPLYKEHAPGEEGLVIWLGLEYRLLPVKIRHLDRNGGIKAEMVVSDIRVSDE